MVRAVVEDSGGTWAGLLAVTATAKVRSVLNEDALRHVIQYRVTLAALDRKGPADDALLRAARRAVRAIGPLLDHAAYPGAVQLQVDLAGSPPDHLSAAMARHVKRRVGR